MTSDRMEELPLYSLSISHRQAPLQIRKLFSFSKEEEQLFLRGMMQAEGVQGAVLVSTCNRTEVYFSGKKEALRRVEELLAKEKHTDLHLLRKYCRIYAGEKVMEHLFYVMSGLDSMVLGEDEILGQMREAYKLAEAEHSTDYYIHAVFQRALNCAKQIKTQTCLSKSSVSVATLCASAVTHFKEGEKTVLLLGATGQMGSLIAKNLSSLSNKADIRIFGTVRRHRGGVPLEGMEGFREVPYERRYEYLDEADVVISATASPHYTLTYEECKQVLVTKKKRLFLDIAVPNDMDPDIGELDDLTLHDIDYFQEIAAEHNRQKEAGRNEAEVIIEEECEETYKELLFHSFVKELPEFLDRYQDKSARQMFYEMRDAADQKELEALLSICRKLCEEER